MQILRGNRIGYPRWVTDRCFLTTLDEYHVDDADHFACVRVVDRAAAVARVGRGIELVDIECSALQLPDQLSVKLLGIAAGKGDRGDR